MVKNLFWSIKNSGEILDNLFMIFLLFIRLYLIILLKINVLILLKEPSIEKVLLTLHETTETHFLLRKKTKKISRMVLSKCM